MKVMGLGLVFGPKWYKKKEIKETEGKIGGMRQPEVLWAQVFVWGEGPSGC